MCGIAGFLSTNGQVTSDLAARVASILEHRGPDDLGYCALRGTQARTGRDAAATEGAEALLVHRRLSIIDLSEAAWQPMSDPTGRYHLAFNGEIYNYIELRSELEAEGVRLRTTSDTEVLLHALIRWGEKALPRLVGMFAFALLDAETREVLLVRDPFGIKPLYYAQTDAGFAFASEIKAVLAFPGVERRLDPQRLYDYLRYGSTDAGEQTLLADVRQLLPGCSMRVPVGGSASKPEPYWSFDPQPAPNPGSFEDEAERLREAFLESIRLHLRSDVQVGACLSGGIDSSAIVSAVRHVAGKDAEIHTFSYIPVDRDLSEESWIDWVNKKIGCIPHKVRPTFDELVRDLDHLIETQDEPFSGTSIYAQHRVFQTAHDAGIKVMLDGQGADELIGGYQGATRTARLVSLLRSGDAIGSMRYLLGVAWHCPDTPLSQLAIKSWGKALARKSAPGAVSGPAWLDSAWFRERGAEDRRAVESIDPEALRAWLKDSALRSSLPHLLRYEDRNSMAFSIESRVPFITPQFAELSLSMPERYLVDNRGTAKALFRRAMRGIVPDEILDRRDKVGFTTPIASWLGALGSWVEGVLTSETAHRMPGLDQERVVAIWRDVRAERRDFGQFMWRWINLIAWAERFEVDLESTEAVTASSG
ncbi:MAG: asparagine synthase (glutamine-hydrolyzing) [Planctomycetota bacterium]